MGSWSESATLFGTLFPILIALFLVVSFLTELLQRRLDPVRIRRWLGGRNRFIGILKGIAVGVVTPFCSTVGVPFLINLLRIGVPFSTAMAFLFASPLMNPFIPAIIGTLFGWRILVGYLVIVIPVCMALAWLLDALGMERFLQPKIAERRQMLLAGSRDLVLTRASAAGATISEAPDDADDAVPAASCGAESQPWRGLRAEWRPAWREAVSGLRDVLPRLVVGVGIAFVINGAVPQGALAEVMAGLGVMVAVPLAAVVGIPLYIREEAALPIAFGLLQAGIGIGPVFAMVLGASGASLPEMALLSTAFRRQLLGAFVFSVFTLAVLGGWLIPLFA